MTDASPSIDSALWTLAELARERPALAHEESVARAEFLSPPLRPNASGDPEAAPRLPDELAEQRFLEWFLLERPSQALDAVPVEALAHSVSTDDGARAALLRERYPSLRNSRVGIFQVTDVRAQQGFWVRDLLGAGRYPVADEVAADAMAEGDLIVGRLFPCAGEDAGFELSRCAGCFRNPELAEALERDLERLRAGRRGPVRIEQRELERMFFGPPGELGGFAAGVAIGSAIEDARVLLERNGLGPAAVDDIFAELTRAPFQIQRFVHGTDDVLGQILASLAFETEVDLEAARRALVIAWPALHARAANAAAAAAAPQRAKDVRAALSSFEAGRAAGQDLETLFRELERDLGLDDDDELEPVVLPDFPGVVGAMVEEFLWEVEREQSAEHAERFAVLRVFGRFASDIGVFENLDRSDLVRFVAFWIPESGELRAQSELDGLFDALEAFVAWARTNHQLDRLEGAEDALSDARTSLPRLQRANAAIDDVEPTAAFGADSEVGQLLEVIATDGPNGEAELVALRTRSGEGLAARILPDAIRYELSPGDRLRGQLSQLGDGLAVRALRCYPSSIAQIERSLP